MDEAKLNKEKLDLIENLCDDIEACSLNPDESGDFKEACKIIHEKLRWILRNGK